jgi:YVTN family beta-propeller protein
MRSNNSNGSRDARAQGFTGAMARPTEAHRAYVTNSDSTDVSVIDRDTNKVAGNPIPVRRSPSGLTSTSDGKHVYVTNVGDNTVSVIDTEKNMVVGEPRLGCGGEDRLLVGLQDGKPPCRRL